MSVTTNPLDDSHGLQVGRGGVPRDRKGNALLRPRGGSFTVPYTPASGLADYLDDPVYLARHAERLVARGLGMREDLAALAGSIPWSPGMDVDDDRSNKAYGRELDTVIARAKDAAGGDIKADYGTAFHRVTEPGVVEAGGSVPTRMQRDVDSFWHAVRGLEIVDTEVFVACDELGSAGTLDHLVRLPSDPCLTVLDKKTGKLDLKANGVQLTTYARGEAYDRDTGERQTFEERYGMPVNLGWALVAHSPAGTGATRLVWVDLTAGHRAAQLAAEVRDHRKNSTGPRQTLDPDATARRRAAELVSQATSREELSDLHGRFSDVWTEEFTQLGFEVLRGS